MPTLAVLLVLLVVVLIVAIVLLTSLGLVSLLSLVVPLIPLLAMVGSVVLGLIDLLLFFGGPEDRRLAKRDLGYLAITFVVSGVLWWVSTHFLWRL